MCLRKLCVRSDMTLFKSSVDKAIDRLLKLQSDIRRRYAKLSGPINAITLATKLTSSQLEAVKSLKQFNFYPRLGHVESTFFDVSQSTSYRFQRAAQLGVINHSKRLPPRVVSVKGNSVRFAKLVGLPTPECEYPLKLEEIAVERPCVIKPVHSEGGRCIYALTPGAGGVIHDLFSGGCYSDEESLRSSIRSDTKKAGIQKDAWLREEMIVGSSGSPLDTFDVKVYTFYGEVGLVLQVDRWHGRRYRFFDPSGRMVNTGKYPSEPDIPPVFDARLIEIAREVSGKIPWAHVRIDFLVSDSDWRFGEFTLRPGGAANFNEEWDRRLGDLFVRAQARLHEDLLLGKEFSEYQSLLSDTGKKA